jgi:uncharacterized caspase-like protein
LLLATILLGGSAPLAAEVRRAISIGISEYPSYPKEEWLQFADLDAAAFAEALVWDHAVNVPVKALYAKEATREKIWDAVYELEKGPRPDTLFLFFSGHGELTAGQKFYLMPFDGDNEHPEVSAIEFKAVLDYLDEKIGAKNLVIFLDTCHSAAAIRGKGSEPEDATVGSWDKLISQANAHFSGSINLFASAGAGELSLEDAENKRGLFTHYLIKGLDGDADGINGVKDGQVTAAELKAYLDRDVPPRSLQIGKRPQTPFVNSDYNGELVLAIPQPWPLRLGPRVQLRGTFR